jgi:hypothetical protein
VWWLHWCFHQKWFTTLASVRIASWRAVLFTSLLNRTPYVWYVAFLLASIWIAVAPYFVICRHKIMNNELQVILISTQKQNCRKSYLYAVFPLVICALFFFYFGCWKIGVRKICGFFLWRSWSGVYSSITENTVRVVNILLQFCNIIFIYQ